MGTFKRWNREFLIEYNGVKYIIETMVFNGIDQYRITWPEDGSVDLLFKEYGEWMSHTKLEKKKLIGIGGLIDSGSLPKSLPKTH